MLEFLMTVVCLSHNTCRDTLYNNKYQRSAGVLTNKSKRGKEKRKKKLHTEKRRLFGIPDGNF